MPTASASTSAAAAAGAPRPTTRFSTSIMKSGVASPSKLMRKDAAASCSTTGRARRQKGMYQCSAVAAVEGWRRTSARLARSRSWRDAI